MMKFVYLVFITTMIGTCVCPPVKVKEKEEPETPESMSQLEYKHYLEEVMKELEKDEDFRKRIEEIDIHNETGKIAQQLDFVNHNVRTRLDEIKRQEVDRLNQLEVELERSKAAKEGKRVPPSHHKLDPSILEQLNVDKDHIDHDNPHTFESSDLERLIKKTMQDLSTVDETMEKDFKQYEMEKELKHKAEMKKIKDEAERAAAEKAYQESLNRHKKHEKVHHPGSEEQLKEVWEKEDHLDPDSFDPHTFFSMHDTNSDGHLDFQEIEALMQDELNKVYEANNTDDDMNERYHEMLRMRREIVSEMDTNKDDMISKKEFIAFTNSKEAKQDPEWKTMEEEDNKPYTDEEFKKFEEDYRRMHPQDTEDDGVLRFDPNAKAPPVRADIPPVEGVHMEEKKPHIDGPAKEPHIPPHA